MRFFYILLMQSVCCKFDRIILIIVFFKYLYWHISNHINQILYKILDKRTLFFLKFLLQPFRDDFVVCRRCICPHGTEGPRCKVTQRFFYGNAEEEKEDNLSGKVERESRHPGTGPSWAWLSALPSCAEVHLSVEFLTTRRNGVLLFSGDSGLVPLGALEESAFSAGLSREFFKSKRSEFAAREGGLNSQKEEFSLRVNSSFAKISNDLASNGRFFDSWKNNSGFLEIFRSSSLSAPREITSAKSVEGTDIDPRPRREATSEHRIRHTKKIKRNRLAKSLAAKRSPPNGALEGPQTFLLDLAWNQKPANISSSFLQKRDNNKHLRSLPYNEETKMREFDPQLLNNSASSNERKKKNGGRKGRTPLLKFGDKMEDEQNDFLMLFLKAEKPYLLLNLGGGNIALSLPYSLPLSDLQWHRIDIIWRDQVRGKYSHFLLLLPLKYPSLGYYYVQIPPNYFGGNFLFIYIKINNSIGYEKSLNYISSGK